AKNVLDRSRRSDQEDLQQDRHGPARRRDTRGSAGGTEEVSACSGGRPYTRAPRKARILLHASSSAAKSFAKQKRSIRFPAAETKKAEPGTEATRACSRRASAASRSSRNSSGISASM